MVALFLAFLHLGWISFYWNGVLATVAPCVENRTDSCKQNLATFISLDRPRFATESELESLCRDAEDGQRCSSDFLRTSSCVNSQDDLHISLQIGRSQGVSEILCSTRGYIQDPAFRKLYLKHSPCIDEHQRKMKECYVSASLTEDPEMEIVRNSSMTTHEKHMSYCCPVLQYIECSENVIESSCGEEAKTVVLKILMKGAGKQLQEFCISVNPTFPNNPMACISAGSIHHFVPFRFMMWMMCSLSFISFIFI